MWTSANGPGATRPEKWEGRAACVACPVGAARAGKPLSAAEVAGERLKGVCTRCQEPHDRLICEGRFCPNCYNRDREHRIGRNRKGQLPRLRLQNVRFAVHGAGKPPEVRTATRVTNAVEAMLLTAKRSSGGAIYFGIPPATLPNLAEPEMEEVPAVPLYADTSGVAEGSAPSRFPNEETDGHRLPGSADTEASADSERPREKPAPIRGGGIDVEPAHAPGKSPAAQVRRDTAIGSMRWLLQGATAFFPAARMAPGRFDALLPFREATLAELR